MEDAILHPLHECSLHLWNGIEVFAFTHPAAPAARTSCVFAAAPPPPFQRRLPPVFLPSAAYPPLTPTAQILPGGCRSCASCRPNRQEKSRSIYPGFHNRLFMLNVGFCAQNLNF